MLTVTFTNGQVSPVTDVRECGLFRTAIARRDDGFCRCVFFDANGLPHDDLWLAPKYPRLSAVRV